MPRRRPRDALEHCSQCGKDELVAFSCKGRGFCPRFSCAAQSGDRRVADLAAHLVDVVLPHVPVRHWVLSLPHRVRFVLAYDPHVCRDVRAIFVRGVLRWIQARARTTGAPNGRGGAVLRAALRFGLAGRPALPRCFLDGV